MTRPSDLPDDFRSPDESGLPLTIVQPVFWGDMDSFGHVNNARYLSWLENVRFEFFERAGVIEWHQTRGQGPILARAEVDYVAPVAFPDRLYIELDVERVGNKSFTLFHRIWSTASNALAATARTVIVMVDYREGGTVAVPQEIRERIDALR